MPRVNRKPAPLRLNSGEQSNNYSNSLSSNEPSDNSPLLEAASHDIKRYSLSDAPISTSGSLTFDAIDDAITRLQFRQSGSIGKEVAQKEMTTSQGVEMGAVVKPHKVKPSLPPRPLAALVKNSMVSEVEQKQRISHSKSSLEKRALMDIAQMLPTINSGEPLIWDDLQLSAPTNPIDDDGDDGETRELSSDTRQRGSGPMDYSQYDESRSTAVAERQFHYDSSLTQSEGNYSYYDYETSLKSNPPSAYYSYSQQTFSATQPAELHSNPYTAESFTDVNNVQGIFDHFNYDAEAYATGVNSHSPYQTSRSQSATPTGDDYFYGAAELSANVIDEKNGYTDPETAYNEERHTQYIYNLPSYNLDEKIPMSDYPDTPLTTRHFGPAPVGRVQRRHKTKKRVQLTNGNLVVDIPVPTKLVLPLRGEPEMTKTRYTAVTCDPDDFERNNFFLRQNEMNRRTELFIVITMYNEDEVLFCRTLHGVMRNISHLCTRKHSQTWGQDAWKKVVVCIVADGRKKIHPRVLDCLAALGVYQEGDFMKNLVNNKAVTAHLFEYTASFALDENLHFRYPDKGIVPTQILFCLKEKNQKKINSHRWFFNAFAPLLQPNVCILLDVGTRPSNKSLYRLWKTFDLNSNVGGACGEIAAYKGKNWVELLNPLVASQNFEYKISNILDKTTESLFGYISVLPGAFSAYRYIALQNDKKGVGPLASYFKGEVLHGRDTDIFTSNLYLAEDRILCFELIAKANADWVLRYVKGAIGETDVPDGLPEFISQRRRWLNGSFFAAVYAIAHTNQILRSGHSTGRKIVLMAETVYNIINLVFAWFAMGNFYLFFIILTSSLEDPSFNLPGIQYFNSIIQYAYASIIVACFLFSMGNKPRASPWKYKLSAICFAIINIYTIVCAAICAVQAARQGGEVYNTMLLSVLATYGVYVFSSLLAFDPWHMLTSFVPYILLTPTYINILNIYAFTNLDDISWGTKQDNIVETDLGAVMQDSNSRVDVEMLSEPSDVNQMYDEALSNLKSRRSTTKAPSAQSDAEKEQQTKDYYANVRTNVVLLWVISNGLLLLAILSGNGVQDTFGTDSTGTSKAKIYLTFILAFVAITSFIRFAGSTMYLIMHMVTG